MKQDQYWYAMFGKQSNEFIKGVIAGVEAFAVWDKGKLFVGCNRVPIKKVIAEIKSELGYKNERRRK